MRAPWIIPGKLGAPAEPPRWLRRRLFAADEALPPVSLLVAGPGYGKTLGLLALAREVADTGGLTLWYGLDPYDAEPATFFHYLVAGVQVHIPQFGTELQALLMTEHAAPHALWQCFFASLSAYGLPGFALVLDDAHHLLNGADAPLLAALAYFFDKLPPGVRVMIGSRKRLPIPVARLQTRGVVAVLDQHRLRFDSNEERTFLTLRGAVEKLGPEMLARLDGWPLGLDLATSRSAPGAWPSEAPVGGDRLTAYVAEELFAAQPPARRDFMMRAAVLQFPSLRACREVLGKVDAAEQLESLEAENLIQRLASGDGFRFPTYLREFLLAEAQARLADLGELHRRAAGYYSAEGASEAAIPHLLAAREWSRAIAACTTSFPAMLLDGRQGQVAHWLAAFPAEVARREPTLRLWQAHGLAQAGNHQEALALYVEVHAACRASGDRAGELTAVVRQAKIHLLAQASEPFERCLEAARSLLASGRAPDRADLSLIQALACEQQGDMAGMGAHNEAVLAIPIDADVEVAATHCIALMNLYTLALHAGDLARAGRLIAQAIALADTWRFHPYHLFARFLEAHLALLAGDLARAGAFVRSLPVIWEDLLDWHDRACAHTLLGFFHLANGDVASAQDAFTRSLALFEEADFVEGTKVPLEGQLYLAVHREDYARAVALAEASVAGDERTIYDLALVLPRARAMHLGGDPPGAAARLDAAIAALDALGARLLATRARLFAAAAWLAAGNHERGRLMLAAARTAIAAQDYHFLERQDPKLWEELAALDAPSASPAGGSASTVPGGVERGGLLELCCFGPFDVRFDGIVLDRWPRRKAKLILAALALAPRGLRIVDLAELVGDGDATSTAFKVNVSALRRALEPELERGEDSRYIKLVDGRYLLDRAHVQAIDIETFAQRVEAAVARREREPERAAELYEEALALYRGNLLEDPFFAPYFEEERAACQTEALGALAWLADHHGRTGDPRGLERVLRRAIEIAPCDEAATLRLMAHLWEHGRPEHARQVYWDCRKAFKAILGLAPGPAIEAAYRALARGEAPSAIELTQA